MNSVDRRGALGALSAQHSVLSDSGAQDTPTLYLALPYISPPAPGHDVFMMSQTQTQPSTWLSASQSSHFTTSIRTQEQLEVGTLGGMMII